MNRLIIALLLLSLPLPSTAHAQMPGLYLETFLPLVANGISLEEPCKCTDEVCVCQE